MGLFGKIKNIFYDEEIIEVPSEEVKREEKPKVEEVKPVIKKEEAPVVKSVNTSVPVYSERELFKSESTFKFPVIDEDEEEESLVRTRSRVNVLDMERTPKREEEKKRDFRFNDTRVTNERREERVFKPSPVISPVYGVLDKNYKKEEIIERQQSIRHNPSDMNYDSVRRKAYGTLEDELENTLTRISEKNNTIENELEEVEEMDTNSKSIEDLLSEIEENRNVSIGEIEERIKDRLEQEEEEESVIDEKEEKTSPNEEILLEDDKKEEVSHDEEEISFDKTLEHDLFNLIDSMYEEKEGE